VRKKTDGNLKLHTKIYVEKSRRDVILMVNVLLDRDGFVLGSSGLFNGWVTLSLWDKKEIGH